MWRDFSREKSTTRVAVMFEIRMDGPGKNALGSEMMDHLLARMGEAGGKPILLTGAGDAFSAGLNLKEVASLDGRGMAAFLMKLEQVMATLFLYPGPVVAAVNGHAIAGGCVLTLCCDHRIAAPSPRIRIGLNEVALGLRFPPGVMGIVRNRLSPRDVERVVLGAELFDPETARRLGFVDELAEDPRAEAERRLSALAVHPPEAYAAAKRDLRAQAVAIEADEQQRFLRESLDAWTSAELRARIRALLSR